MRLAALMSRLLGLTLIAATTISCRSTVDLAVCQTGNLGAVLDPESARLVNTTQSPWVREAVACKIGEYVVVTPKNGGSGQLFLVRKGQPAFIIDDGTTSLVDVDGKRVLFQSTGARPSGGNFVSYSAYDFSQDAWIENLDSGPDGTIDLRTTEVSGRPAKTEFRVGERWLERINRNGQDGTVLDGQFMSMADARAKLGKTTHEARPK